MKNPEDMIKKKVSQKEIVSILQLISKNSGVLANGGMPITETTLVYSMKDIDVVLADMRKISDILNRFIEDKEVSVASESE